jgi:hypothetical protein
MVQVHEVGATPMPEDGLMHALRLTGNAHIWMLLLTFHNLSSKSNEFCDIILVMLSDLLATFSFTFFCNLSAPSWAICLTGQRLTGIGGCAGTSA